MNVTYPCPVCHAAVRNQFTHESTSLACPHCQAEIEIPAGAVGEGQVHRCLVCPSTDLYARKDFPQRLGVSLVVIGFVASSIAWANYQVIWSFAILFATALIDLVLYIAMGNSLMCYRCNAQYRGVEELDTHGGFDLETHERYRQMVARINQSPPGSQPAQGT